MQGFGPLAVLVWSGAALILLAALMFVLAWLESTLPDAPRPAHATRRVTQLQPRGVTEFEARNAAA
jgi:hypothetical protein